MSKKINYCQVKECINRVSGSGYCMKHYKRWKKYGDPLVNSKILRTKLFESGFIKCSTCRKDKEIKDFKNNKTRANGKSGSCGSCNYNFHLIKKYGIDLDAYNNLLLKQNNVCAICKGEQKRDGVRLSVDHDHKTKEIRGLLCDNCNRAIGFLQDDIERIFLVAEYVESNKNKNIPKWDRRFLYLARHISRFSLDPSTKVGAVIVDHQKRIISTGYNGLPQSIIDSHERLNDREIKYQIICHAEENAILFSKTNLNGFTLFVYPFQPCSHCASLIIQSGISRVISFRNDNDRWKESFDLSLELFNEAKIEVQLYDQI